MKLCSSGEGKVECRREHVARDIVNAMVWDWYRSKYWYRLRYWYRSLEVIWTLEGFCRLWKPTSLLGLGWAAAPSEFLHSISVPVFLAEYSVILFSVFPSSLSPKSWMLESDPGRHTLIGGAWCGGIEREDTSKRYFKTVNKCWLRSKPPWHFKGLPHFKETLLSRMFSLTFYQPEFSYKT